MEAGGDDTEGQISRATKMEAAQMIVEKSKQECQWGMVQAQTRQLVSNQATDPGTVLQGLTLWLHKQRATYATASEMEAAPRIASTTLCQQPTTLIWSKQSTGLGEHCLFALEARIHELAKHIW